VIAVIRYEGRKPRSLVASLAVMLTAAFTTALVSVLVAYTPALAQSTAADTRHPRVIDVRPAEGAKAVSPTRRVVAFFSEDMKPGSAMWAI
jgi:Bacterial Ig-like domain